MTQPAPTPSHLGIITAGAVAAEQARTLAAAQADNAAIQACTGIDAATKAAWNTFYAALTAWCQKTVYNLPWPWEWFDSNGVLVSGDTGETMMSYEAQLIAWERKLAPSCPGLGPNLAPLVSDPGPSDNTTSIVKWGAVALAALAGAYVVSQVVPPIVRLLPNRSSNEKKNPLAQSAGHRKSSGKALIAKATAVRLHMADGRLIKPRGTMMHDESGRAWPRNSLIIGPFKPNTHGPVPDNRFEGAPRYYLGRGYKARYGTVNLPPRSLRAWKFVGYASRGEPEDGEIQYVRRGIRAPGGFYHPWNKPMLFGLIQGGKGRVRLYRYGAFYRLEMPRGATVNDRGFVRP